MVVVAGIVDISHPDHSNWPSPYASNQMTVNSLQAPRCHDVRSEVGVKMVVDGEKEKELSFFPRTLSCKRVKDKAKALLILNSIG